MCYSLISGYIRVTLSNISAERQCRTIRQILFRSILKKDIVYFDQHKTGELSLDLSDNVNKIRDGIGDQLGLAIEMISTFISGLAIGKIFSSE
jgi:ATP-binding cassette, subfamily B (MDR/TAP), member 1